MELRALFRMAAVQPEHDEDVSDGILGLDDIQTVQLCFSLFGLLARLARSGKAAA